jgi:probable rRNA maturation factor
VGPIVLVSNLDEHTTGVSEADLTAAAELTLADHPGAEVSLTFVSDDEISLLNQEYLQRTGPTDVIAFCLGDHPLVGDVYVSVDTARRNAETYGITLEEELTRLVVHGALHVLGHSHPEDDSRHESPMFELQEDLVARLLKNRPQR